MGVCYHCPNCSTGIGLNTYAKAKENGYCINCDIEDLRRAVKSTKTAHREALVYLRKLGVELGEERIKNLALETELRKHKPAPVPCTRCQCPACCQIERMRQYNAPYNAGGTWL